MKNRIEVVFEHTSWGYVWRGVRGADGGYRVDKRGLKAKSWTTIVWCGRDILEKYRPEGSLMDARYHRRDYVRGLRRAIEKCRKVRNHAFYECPQCDELREALEKAYAPS